MSTKNRSPRDEVEVIDARGYFVEQFLCRQTCPVPEVYSTREEILDQIYLAVSMVEEVAANGLSSTVMDISSEASGMTAQLFMRGFTNVIAVPETTEAADKLRAEATAEGWNINLEAGIQENFVGSSTGPAANSVDVVLFMDSNFGRFRTSEEQRAVLGYIAGLMRKGGSVILDLSNPVERIRNMRTAPVWAEDDNNYYLMREVLDPVTLSYSTDCETVSKTTGQAEGASETGVLITMPALSDLLRQSGLSLSRIYGSYDKGTFRGNSTRMIVIAEK